MIAACTVCIERPRWRKAERFETSAVAELALEGGVEHRRVLDISIGGMRLAGNPPAVPGTRLAVRVGRELQLDGTIVRSGPGEFSLRLDNSPQARKTMIAHIYSGRYNAMVPVVKIRRVAAAVVGRLMA